MGDLMLRDLLQSFSCETLDPRQLLTTVYEPDFVAHTAGGPTPDSAATLLDSGAVTYFNGMSIVVVGAPAASSMPWITGHAAAAATTTEMSASHASRRRAVGRAETIQNPKRGKMGGSL